MDLMVELDREYFPHKRILFKAKYNPNYWELPYKKCTKIPRKHKIANIYGLIKVVCQMFNMKKGIILK